MHALRFVLAGAVVLGMSAAAPAQQVVAPARPPLVSASEARTPIRLQRAEVEVSTAGSLARTTLLLTLHNPNDRLLEGSLQFPLQAGQQVVAFALDIGGQMRDAVPVPKERGRQVFESIERRGVDPGLLEQTAGNQFRLRVYPIPAHGTRTVRLVLDETMRRDGDDWRMDLPVHLLAGAADFSLRVQAQGVRGAPQASGAFEALRFRREGEGWRVDVQRQAFRPQAGLLLRFPGLAEGQAYVAQHAGEHYAVAEIPLPAVSRPRRIPGGIGLLWDASASARQRDREGEFALLDAYFKAMGQGRVHLRLLRDTGEDGGVFPVEGGDWSALRKALEAAVQDGASNLSDWVPQAGIDEYLLFSDGLQNYGDEAFPRLNAGQRLFALNGAGAQGDNARLAGLAETRGGRAIGWQGRAGREAAQRALLEEGVRVTALHGDGVTDLVAQARQPQDGMLRVAGRLLEASGTIRVELDLAGTQRRFDIPVRASAEPRAQAATSWAAWRVAEFSAEPQQHRASIERLGRDFGLVTSGTSLLVLEDPADYVRYDIPAPIALGDTVDRLRAEQRVEKSRSESEHLDEVAARFAARIEWWQREFPKGAPPPAKKEAARQRHASGAAEAAAIAADAASVQAVAAPAPPPPPAPASAPVLEARFATAERADLDAINVTGSRAESGEAGEGVSIQLQPWQPDSAYARRLRDVPATRVYALYLDERDSHAGSTAFYLDVADLLLQRGRRAEALRVLSNLAELELESRHVLRVLGYRLMQAEAWPQAVQVFRRVLDIAGEEPQSWRDLGLALAKAGDPQQGIEKLYEVARRLWDARFDEIDAVALNEMNAIIAMSAQRLDTGFIDRRLLRNMPLDMRAVLAWDSDNSDMDLWVTDPNGEKCFYSNRLTYQGGLISDDFTGGYGPEEFVLRDAKPGKYRVEANYFGDRQQQVVTGGTTLTLTLSTGWGTPRQLDRKVTLRLSGQSETVLVGEFEVE